MSLDIDRLKELAAKGLNASEIARSMGESRFAVRYAANKHNIEIVKAVSSTGKYDVRQIMPTDEEVEKRAKAYAIELGIINPVTTWTATPEEIEQMCGPKKPEPNVNLYYEKWSDV